MNQSSLKSQPQSKKWQLLKLIISAIVVVTAIFIFKLTPLGKLLNLSNLQAMKESLGIWAPLAYVAIYAVATILAVPGIILTLSGGVLFGPLLGTLWTAIGALLGAIGAFLIARFMAGDWARQQFEKGERLRQLSQGLIEEGFWFALSIRLAPVFPFIAVNYLLGLTPISMPAYVLATAVGILPGTFAYTWLGSSGLTAVTGGPPWQLAGALAVLAVLSALPLIIKWLKSRTADSTSYK